MSDAKISFRCPGCEELVSFLGTEAGTVQDCPGCGGWVDVPELFRSPKNEDPLVKESERQFAENARQQVENARLLAQSFKSHEEWERQLIQAARYQDLAEETFERLAALVTRWEILAGRLEAKLSEPG
jgi:hypothetical protein